MKITPVPDKKSKIFTEHNGEKIEWDVAILGRLTADENYDIYEHINAYWARLTPPHQDAIFDVYKEIHQIFEDTYNPTRLQLLLFKPVAKLMSLHKLEDVKFWTDFTPSIYIPSDLSDVYKDTSENKITPERTYLRSDYQWLVAMIVALRSMIPVWGRFIERSEKEIGVNFKEYMAFQLLAESEIVDSIPMQKLRAFTGQNIWPEKSKPSAIWGSLSSEDFPEWIVSLVVVRRLSTADIRGIEQDKHPVKRMFSFVRHRAGTHESNFVGRITEKVFDGAKQDGENNLSVFEGYKNKQQHSAGEIAPFQFIMRRPMERARQICPDIDLKLVEQALNASNRARKNRVPIMIGQLRLIQMVMRKVLPPRAVEHLDRKRIANAAAVAQAVLWHRGHQMLASFITASAIPNRDYMSFGAGSPEPINKQLMEKLLVLYPYINNPSQKPKSVKQTNAASVNIDLVTDHFTSNEWTLNIHEEWLPLVTGNKNNRRVTVPRDFKNKLAELAIQLAERSF